MRTCKVEEELTPSPEEEIGEVGGCVDPGWHSIGQFGDQFALASWGPDPMIFPLSPGCAEGYARDATEVQNIQIADGDICRNLSVPLYMVFPRLFTCPTLETTNFKVGKLCRPGLWSLRRVWAAGKNSLAHWAAVITAHSI